MMLSDDARPVTALLLANQYQVTDGKEKRLTYYKNGSTPSLFAGRVANYKLRTAQPFTKVYSTHTQTHTHVHARAHARAQLVFWGNSA